MTMDSKSECSKSTALLSSLPYIACTYPTYLCLNCWHSDKHITYAYAYCLYYLVPCFNFNYNGGYLFTYEFDCKICIPSWLGYSIWSGTLGMCSISTADPINCLIDDTCQCCLYIFCMFIYSTYMGMLLCRDYGVCIVYQLPFILSLNSGYVTGYVTLNWICVGGCS